MTTTHLVRGLYIAVSVAVAIAALWRSTSTPRTQDRVAGCAFASYAVGTAAAQIYAFDLPLTVGTAYVGFGIAAGFGWLTALWVAQLRKRGS